MEEKTEMDKELPNGEKNAVVEEAKTGKPVISEKDTETLIKLLQLNPDIDELPQDIMAGIAVGKPFGNAVSEYENKFLRKKVDDLQLMLKAEKKKVFNRKSAVSGIESEGEALPENGFIAGLYSAME